MALPTEVVGRGLWVFWHQVAQQLYHAALHDLLIASLIGRPPKVESARLCSLFEAVKGGDNPD